MMHDERRLLLLVARRLTSLRDSENEPWVREMQRLTASIQRQAQIEHGKTRQRLATGFETKLKLPPSW